MATQILITAFQTAEHPAQSLLDSSEDEYELQDSYFDDFDDVTVVSKKHLGSSKGHAQATFRHQRLDTKSILRERAIPLGDLHASTIKFNRIFPGRELYDYPPYETVQRTAARNIGLAIFNGDKHISVQQVVPLTNPDESRPDSTDSIVSSFLEHLEVNHKHSKVSMCFSGSTATTMPSKLFRSLDQAIQDGLVEGIDNQHEGDSSFSIRCYLVIDDADTRTGFPSLAPASLIGDIDEAEKSRRALDKPGLKARAHRTTHKHLPSPNSKEAKSTLVHLDPLTPVLPVFNLTAIVTYHRPLNFKHVRDVKRDITRKSRDMDRRADRDLTK